jgi:hypothetical protein
MSLSDKGIIWGYGIQAAAFATSVAASSGLRVRREGSLPDFKPGMTPIEAPIHRGLWGDHASDRRAGHYAPSFSMPGLLRPGLLQIGLDQVMVQTGPDASGNYTYALKSGTTHVPGATKSLSLIRRNTFDSSGDKRLTGCYIKSIKISSSLSQQKVNCDIEWIAWDYDDDQDESGGTFTIPTENWLTHAGLAFEIGAGNDFQIPEYDLTIDFGTLGILDNATNPQEFQLGPLQVTGNVRPPYVDGDVVGDFEAQNENTLIWTWGTVSLAGHLKIEVPVKYDEPDEDTGEERLRQGIPFKYNETDSQALEIGLNVDGPA